MKEQPLLVAQMAPRARVPSTVYVPPPLQANGFMWHPEFMVRGEGRLRASSQYTRASALQRAMAACWHAAQATQRSLCHAPPLQPGRQPKQCSANCVHAPTAAPAPTCPGALGALGHAVLQHVGRRRRPTCCTRSGPQVCPWLPRN